MILKNLIYSYFLLDYHGLFSFILISVLFYKLLSEVNSFNKLLLLNLFLVALFYIGLLYNLDALVGLLLVVELSLLFILYIIIHQIYIYPEKSSKVLHQQHIIIQVFPFLFYWEYNNSPVFLTNFFDNLHNSVTNDFYVIFLFFYEVGVLSTAVVILCLFFFSVFFILLFFLLRAAKQEFLKVNKTVQLMRKQQVNHQLKYKHNTRFFRKYIILRLFVDYYGKVLYRPFTKFKINLFFFKYTRQTLFKHICSFYLYVCLNRYTKIKIFKVPVLLKNDVSYFMSGLLFVAIILYFIFSFIF